MTDKKERIKYREWRKRVKPFEEFQLDNGAIIRNQEDKVAHLLIRTPNKHVWVERVPRCRDEKVYIVMAFNSLDCGQLVDVYNNPAMANKKKESCPFSVPTSLFSFSADMAGLLMVALFETLGSCLRLASEVPWADCRASCRRPFSNGWHPLSEIPALCRASWPEARYFQEEISQRIVEYQRSVNTLYGEGGGDLPDMIGICPQNPPPT